MTNGGNRYARKYTATCLSAHLEDKVAQRIHDDTGGLLHDRHSRVEHDLRTASPSRRHRTRDVWAAQLTIIRQMSTGSKHLPRAFNANRSGTRRMHVLNCRRNASTVHTSEGYIGPHCPVLRKDRTLVLCDIRWQSIQAGWSNIFGCWTPSSRKNGE